MFKSALGLMGVPFFPHTSLLMRLPLYFLAFSGVAPASSVSPLEGQPVSKIPF